MTRDQFLQRFPNASPSTLRANGFGSYAIDPFPKDHAGDTGPVAKLERDPGHESLEARQVQAPTPARFLVRFTSIRARLIDEDNLMCKYFCDCLRYAGLIPGDDPATAHIEVTQRKKTKGEQERVEIVIERLS